MAVRPADFTYHHSFRYHARSARFVVWTISLPYALRHLGRNRLVSTLSHAVHGLSSGLPSARPVKGSPNLAPVHPRVSPWGTRTESAASANSATRAGVACVSCRPTNRPAAPRLSGSGRISRRVRVRAPSYLHRGAATHAPHPRCDRVQTNVGTPRERPRRREIVNEVEAEVGIEPAYTALQAAA